MDQRSRDLKRETLGQFGVFHTSDEAVRDELFLGHEFFDPRDLIQVRYEMLRRVHLDGVSIRQAASDFGFSRTTFYQVQALFEQAGLPGLIPKRPGPRHAHKLSDEVLEFLLLQCEEASEPPRSDLLAELVYQEFGLSVHPRSIERAFSKHQKKGR
jgi:transposase